MNGLVMAFFSHFQSVKLLVKRFALFGLAVLVLYVCIFTQAAIGQGFQPVPISEYAEQVGPNEISFLSYPKYYRNALGNLDLVNPIIAESNSDEWDYEVTSGVWILRIRADGTFRAEHMGNVFTYRLSQIGVGRGERFNGFEWGNGNWKDYRVFGDTIRWTDVFSGVDFSVRYIHDILKVDVIVKAERMKDIRNEIQKGNLDAEDYLTARFEIPELWFSGEVRQGGKKRDLYEEIVDATQPLEFVKDGKVVQRLRAVETYVLDSSGKRLNWERPWESQNKIKTAQCWYLKKSESGVAEISANLGDLLLAPEGDVCIDPPTVFEGEGFYLGGDIYDAYIDSGNPNSMYGTNDYLYLGNIGGEKRILLGVCHSSTKIGYGMIINSAVCCLYVNGAPSSAQSIRAKAYKGIENWYMSTVTWNDNGFNNPPSTTWSGGEYTTSFSSPDVTLPVSQPQYTEIQFDITDAFKSHYETSTADPGDKGFLIKLIDTPNPALNWSFFSTENSSVLAEYRPKVNVSFTIPSIGLYRDSGCTNVLDDWQETAAQERSPKYLFAQEDNIYIKVNGISGKGNNYYSVLVKSQSDQTGIVINLNETSSGIYQNTSGEYLRLSTSTAEGSPADTIKVIDEEILTFDLLVSNHVVTQNNVMVDRAEFASCGINCFYGAATGDRATVRNQALTLTDFWDAGDGNYADDVGGALGNAMETFIKNMGSNNALHGEADILHISCHGEGHGKLYDNDGPVLGLIVEPLNGDNGIVNASDWNNDSEWVVIAACSSLWPFWGLDTGGRRWGEALKGSSRKAHGICGAWDLLDGDLRDVWNDFWSRLRNNELIMSAYSIAMENHINENLEPAPQPWAIVYYEGNQGDKLKERYPDLKGIPNLLYLDFEGVINFPDEFRGLATNEVSETIDSGLGKIKCRIPQNINLKDRIFQINGKPQTQYPQKNFDNFVRRDAVSTAVEYVADHALNRVSSLTKTEVQNTVKEFLNREFPELTERIKFKYIAEQKMMNLSSLDSGETKTTGYLVVLEICYKDIPVIGYHVVVKLSGNDISFVNVRDYELLAQNDRGNETKSFQSAHSVLLQGLPEAKQLLAFKENETYDVVETELCYVSVKKQADRESNELALAWRFKLDRQGVNGIKQYSSNVYLDVDSGKVIDFTLGEKR